MIYTILYALSPIFIITLLGFYAGKSKMIDNHNVSTLNSYVMDFALPVTLFSATVTTPWEGILGQWQLIIVLVSVMWIVYAVLYFILIKIFNKSASEAAVLCLTVALPNYAALGLPILNSVLKNSNTASLSVAIAISCGSIFASPFCLLILEREKAKKSNKLTDSTLTMLPLLIGRSFKKPIIWGPILGIVLSDFSIKMPPLLLGSIQPLGLAATASALFLTGLILSARKMQLNRIVVLSCITKLLLQPLLGWGVVILLGIEGSLAITAILMLALSAGFFGIVFGTPFGVESPDAEATLLLTSLLCIITLPLFIFLVS